MIVFKLRTYIFIAISSLALLLTMTMSYYFTEQTKQKTIENMSEYGIGLAHNTTHLLADYLITEDYGSLQFLIRDIIEHNKRVDHIEVADFEWRVVAASRLENLGGFMPRTPPGTVRMEMEDEFCLRHDDSQEHLIITSPIVIGGEMIGNTRIFITMNDVLQSIEAIGRNGLLIGISFWLFSLAFSFYLSRFLTSPVNRFIASVEKVKEGSFDFSPPETSRIKELNLFSQVLSMAILAVASRERDLSAAVKKYSELFERALEGIFIADATGRLIDVNPAFSSLLGDEEKGETLKRNLFGDIFTLGKDGVFIDRMNSEGFLRGFELEFRRADNDTVLVSLACHLVRDKQGEATRYEGLVRDISRQRRAEQELMLMSSNLKNIIESMPNALLTLDRDFTVNHWNGAAKKISGISASKAIGMNLFVLLPFLQDYQPKLIECRDLKKPVWINRARIKGEEERVYDMTFFPLLAEKGAGIAISIEDVSELDSKEQQLRQAQKMESVGLLAGGLAHDFNNVLGGIIGNLSFVEFGRKNGSMSEDQLDERLERISLATNRAVGMVRQLLTLSRKQKNEMVPVDINKSINNISKLAESSFDKTVSLVYLPLKEPAWVLANPIELEQAILNLCINGAHAMTIMRDNHKDWGGELRVELDRGRVDEAFISRYPKARFVDYWRIRVSDTGVGIDKKHKKKLFEPFFTTKPQGKGTGLGLAMVVGIVEGWGGVIDFDSTPGKGTVFNICLPVLSVEAKEKVEPKAEKIKLASASKKTVLVVEDEDFVRTAARDILKSVGYKVLLAADGAEGAELFRANQQQISLVLLDMVMPQMSGRETFVELKKTDPGVAVLICSGFGQDEKVEELLQMGAKGFLQKPYSMSELLETVAKTLNNHK